MRFSVATVFSALVGLSVAYTAPDYTKNPTGNAISSPGLNEIVPEGKTYTIKWSPTTTGPISLVLLRGPSTNVVPLKTLAESIPNSGEFKWTPGSDLEADVSHYGLLLVVEGTGQYQYSTQFGLSAAAGSSSSSSSSSIATESVEVTTTICPETETSAAASAPTSSTVVESVEVTTTICPETESTAAATTPAPKATTTGLSPVGPPSSTPLSSIRLTTSAVPSGTASASPSASSPVFNSAGRNAASFGAVMAGVLAAFAL